MRPFLSFFIALFLVVMVWLMAAAVANAQCGMRTPVRSRIVHRERERVGLFHRIVHRERHRAVGASACTPAAAKK